MVCSGQHYNHTTYDIKKDALQHVLQAAVHGHYFKSVYDKKLGEITKGTKLPGFRPGKVPKALLDKRYGPALMQETTEEVVDEKQLLQQAIDREASSSNEAANRQEFIDNIDTQIIVLTGDIQFLSQQLDLTNIYNRQLQELIDSQNAEIISINEQMVELDKTNKAIRLFLPIPLK